jgi:hypothetical protein
MTGATITDHAALLTELRAVRQTAIDALRATARAVSRELGARHWPPHATASTPATGQAS